MHTTVVSTAPETERRHGGGALTEREMREGLVDGQDVARGVERGLFWRLEVVVRDDVVVRVDALPCARSVSIYQGIMGASRDAPTTPGPSPRDVPSDTPPRWTQ